MVLPELKARWRTDLCGESGLALIWRALCHSGNVARRRAAISAPLKLGIRPRAPGKRATSSFSKIPQIFSRISFLASMSNPPSPLFRKGGMITPSAINADATWLLFVSLSPYLPISPSSQLLRDQLRSPSSYWRTATSAMAAVSVLKIRCPNLTGINPSSFAKFTSSSVKPPSGPTIT